MANNVSMSVLPPQLWLICCNRKQAVKAAGVSSQNSLYVYMVHHYISQQKVRSGNISLSLTSSHIMAHFYQASC